MRRSHTFTAAAALTLVSGLGNASADELDKVGSSLIKYEAEVRQIGQQVSAPLQFGAGGANVSQRRLINAQVAFGIGNYDDAAIMLYDLVDKGESERWHDEAIYYLAESLFQKRDYVGARTYFTRLVRGAGSRSAYYQQSLERLVELSLKLDDDTDVTEWLEALSRVATSERRASVPYVRGRYLYFSGDHGAAVEAFKDVPAKSEYFIRARYFLGAAHVSAGEIAEAATVFQELTRDKGANDTDRRVIELSHLAMGRLYYEREQPSKAIDEYLMISRKSDMFDEALFEIAWVYVKDKQFDKALRALELLALANPESAMLPDVRILEGNLRIRKAAIVEETGDGNSLEEYGKAMTVFEGTRATYEAPRLELERIISERQDPRAFVHQITGRGDDTFDVDAARLPPVAVAWLREEPEVRRVVTLDQDLVAIRSDVTDAEAQLDRVESAMNSRSAVKIFPALAETRMRLTEITESVVGMRQSLAREELSLLDRYANASEKQELTQLRAERARLEQELATLPDAGMTYGDRVTQAHENYEVIDKRAQQLSVIIDTTGARLVAVEKYLSDQRAAGVPEEELSQYKQAIEDLRSELDAVKESLAEVRRDILLGQDQAGVGDREALRAQQINTALERVLDKEHKLFTTVAGRMSGADRTRADQISNLTTKATLVIDDVRHIDGKIDEIVDVGLAEVRTTVAEERTQLATYKSELNRLEGEAQQVGGEVLSGTFGKVSNKFYEVLVRADVGTIDVAWATREQADRSIKRLRLDQARERRILDEEFGDVIQDRRAAARNAPEGDGQ